MENGWVIEHGASEVSRPRYWGGVHGWTYDNLQAVRFAREEDARSQAEAMDDGFPNNYRIAEHGWGTEPEGVLVPRSTLEWIKKKTADKRNPAVAFVCDKLLRGENFSPLRDHIPETQT